MHKNVKPRSGDAATIQRFGKGSFVHNCAARRIDKERSGLHQVKALRIHKPAGLVRERAMQRDNIGIFEKRVELRPLITLGQLPFRAAVYENFHAERRAELCDGLPDMSEADDAERFAVQLKQRVRAVAHRFGLIPVAAAGGGAYFFGVIAQLQKQRKRLLRDGLHAIKRHITHGDAQFSCGFDIDSIIPRCKKADKAQLRQFLHDFAAYNIAVQDDSFGVLCALHDFFGLSGVIHGDAAERPERRPRDVAGVCRAAVQNNDMHSEVLSVFIFYPTCKNVL